MHCPETKRSEMTELHMPGSGSSVATIMAVGATYRVEGEYERTKMRGFLFVLHFLDLNIGDDGNGGIARVGKHLGGATEHLNAADLLPSEVFGQ